MDELAKVSQETLDLVKSNLGKAVTTATGLMGYSLEAPSKHLFPFFSPLRNRIPRKTAQTGTSTHWKKILDIRATGKLTTSEGNRGNTVEYVTGDGMVAFKSYALQDAVTLEAIAAGRNFEDAKALATTNLLLKTMNEEEKLILAGQVDSLGTVTGLSLTPATGGEFAAAVTGLSVKVAALTLVACNSAVMNQQLDNLYLNVADGVTLASAASTCDVAKDGKVTVSVTPVKGAFGYAIFAGTAGNESLQLVSGTSVAVLTKLVTGGTKASDITADTSGDPLAFPGIITQAITDGGYFLDMKGQKLAKSVGGVQQLDDINSYMFNRYKVGITRWYVSEQISKDITDAVLGGQGRPYMVINDSDRNNLTANYVVTEYVNKSYAGQRQIIEVHPWLPQGCFFGIVESIPYPNANIPAVLEMEMGFDYMQIEYAQTKPQYEFEVRAFGALKHYFPVGTAFICNVAPGVQ
jgi:hypothetical protein